MGFIKIPKAIILFFLSLLSLNSIAQQKTFTENNEEKFVEEIKDFFTAEDKRKGNDFIDPFILNFWNSKATPEQKAAIIKNCNLMLKKRLKAFPDFKNYFNTLQNFAASSQSDKSYKAWEKSFDMLLTKAKLPKSFPQFLEVSDLLFTSNTLYRSPSTEWRASNNNFVFDYDSVPKVNFNKVDLSCYAKDDTSTIYNTSGSYYLLQERFYGKGGKILWIRAGIPENESYADFTKNYKLDLKTSQYKLDSVIYHNTKYFDRSLLGSVDEKCTSGEKGEKASYPKFDSYNKRLKISNLAPDIDYDGGFSMYGAKFIGAGTAEEEALIKIKVKGKIVFTAASKSFVIRPDRIQADRAATNFYFEKDSIYHPGCVFKLNLKERQVTLFRDGHGIALSPFFDSYHDIDMDVEAVYWKIDEKTIEMKTLLGGSATTANFESSTFYRELRFMKIQGMDESNPLVRLRNFSDKNKTLSFSGTDFTAYMKSTADQINPMLLKLSTMGFIEYDVDKNWVTIKDRLFLYCNARIGKADYDIIEFNSDIKGKPNAVLNLLNWDLKLNGVEQIALSDSQNVRIYPTDQELTLQKDRNFKFAGRVIAGRFEFFGKEFSFEYNNFKINLTNTDSLRIKVRSRIKDDRGEYPLVRCKTVIENINGDLIIDKPYNKSGVKNNPEYPIFNSYKPSFAYYDKRNLWGPVYKRNTFYFQLDPFTIDSVDNFTEEALALAGEMSSAGIFPKFREKIRLQEDYSLGFKSQTPAEGYAAYGGKGHYQNEIRLSNQGMRGDGILKYVASTTNSKDFIFFPDSMNSKADRFVVQKQTGKPEFPAVEGDDVYIHWMPYQDYMNTHTIKKPMDFYNKQASFTGYTTLEPTGLEGNGKVGFAQASLKSNKMVFKSMVFDADTADFDIENEGMSDLAFSTVNVKAHIDFAERTGEFKTNGKGSLVRFPANQYRCFMDQFKWHMDRKDIELTASKGSNTNSNPSASDIDLDGPEFISEHPEQDSLRFFASKAKYDIKKNIIYCKEVKYINVADARIYPDSGNVVIERKAKIDELKNTKILANSVTKYHNIYQANTFIYGRKSYNATGYYDYEDEEKQKFKIFFNKISNDTTGQTVAQGDIADTSKFALSPNFDYYGKILLFASNQFLTFKGGVKIVHGCESIAKNWFNFESEINPKEIYIPVSEKSSDRENNKLTSGIVLTNSDSIHIYSAFLSKKEAYNDIDIVSSEGFLYFDKTAKEYKISNKDKLKEINFTGNFISLNANNCVIYGEGKINLAGDLGQVKMQTFGNAKNNLTNKETNLDLVTTLDFFFDEGAIKKISEALDANTGAEAVNYNRFIYERALREMLGKEPADKLLSQLNLYGNFKKFPSEMEHTFVFTDLQMKWSDETKSFVSDGKIGVGNIFKNQLNKKVEGKIELIKKRSGDILNIYLKVDDNNWYYFNYQNGLMQAIASDEKFNETIKLLKPDKRKAETKEKGQKPYAFNISTERKKKDFLKKFEKPE